MGEFDRLGEEGVIVEDEDAGKGEAVGEEGEEIRGPAG